MSADGAAPLLRQARAAKRLARLPIFTERDYLIANPDVAQAGIDAVTHALQNGAAEGRTLFSETALARAYGRAGRRDTAAGSAGSRRGYDAARAGHRCAILVHSLSDEAYRETAQDLAADLGGLGFDIEVLDETADPWGDHGTPIVVAPHDFFSLGLGQLWAEPSIVGDMLVVMDDPAESVEGGRCLRPLLDARGAIELSAVGAELWAEADIPTFRLLPKVRVRDRWLEAADLGHPLMLAAPERAREAECHPLDWSRRPLDLLFFARESPRRNAALGRLAGSLAPHRCFVYAQQGIVSKAEERLHRGAHWRISGHLSTQARLTLHVSEGRFPALERRRIVVQAMAGGSTVVSTSRFADPGLEPGSHYFHEDAKHIGHMINWLIVDPDGRRAAERVRDRAFDRIAAVNRDRNRLAGLGAFLVDRGGPEGRVP